MYKYLFELKPYEMNIYEPTIFLNLIITKSSKLNNHLFFIYFTSEALIFSIFIYLLEFKNPLLQRMHLNI